MSDDFDQLKAALRAAPPPPDPAARARAIAQAMENYDRLQASDRGAVPQDGPGAAAGRSRLRQILGLLSAKPALAATTSVAALVLGVAVILPVVGDLTAPSVPQPVPPPAPMGKLAPAAPPAPAVLAAPAAEDPAAAAGAGDAGVSASGAMARIAPAPAPVAEEAPVMAEMAAEMAADSLAEGALLAPPPEAELRLQAAPAPSAALARGEGDSIRLTAEAPVATVPRDVDSASWARLRHSLDAGRLPAPAELQIGGLVNHFPYDYPAPEGDAAFAGTVAVMPTPWNPGTRLVTIGLQGATAAHAERPPLNLVLLVDHRGAGGAGLLRQALALALPELRPEDQIAIVTREGAGGQLLPPTPATAQDRILAALDMLPAPGAAATAVAPAGAEGLELAYRLAAEMAAPGEVSRVLLASDGPLDLAGADPAALEQLIAGKRAEGIDLSVLGFGQGAADAGLMQALARSGNGTAGFAETLPEARKLLVDQLAGAFIPLADDVKVQVEWNPDQVAEYRLIGYDSGSPAAGDMAMEIDPAQDAAGAGGIGAGLQVTAIYEVAAPGSPGIDPGIDPGASRRAGKAAMATPADPALVSDELGTLRLHWTAPGSGLSQLLETPISGLEPATGDTRFAVAIAGFGQLLARSSYLGDWGWPQAIALADAARGEDPYGYRGEAVELMRLAESLAR